VFLLLLLVVVVVVVVMLGDALLMRRGPNSLRNWVVPGECAECNVVL
jgi:hypothetical protein